MPAICTTSYGNPGVRCDKGDIRGVPTGLILAVDSQSFSSYANAVTEAQYETGIKAKTLFPLPGIQEFDNNSEETVLYTSPLGIDKFLRQGKYKFVFRYDMSSYQYKQMQGFQGAKIRAYVTDSENQAWGYSDDGTTVQGMSASIIVGNQGVSDGATPGFAEVIVTLTDPNQWNKYGMILQPDFVISDLPTIANVDVTVSGTPTATELIVDVNQANNVIQDGGTTPSIPITGLLEADFTILKASDGSAQTADTFTDNADGTYTFDFTGLVAGTVSLVAPASQTGDQYVESTGAASFTI